MAADPLQFPRLAPAPLPERLLFGEFELHLETRELFRNEQPVRIQDQPARLLELLAGRAGRLVSRDEIRSHLWGDSINVDFEQSINFCVKQLRRTLGDSAGAPRFVETVPRRGYRFVAPVQRTTIATEKAAAPAESEQPKPAPTEPALTESTPQRFQIPPAVVLTGLLVLAAAVSFSLLRTTPRTTPQTAPPATAPIPQAAQAAYEEGLFLIDGNVPDYYRARTALKQAVELAPDFAAAHAAIARTMRYDATPPEEALATAQRAVELDPMLATAHMALGSVLIYKRRDWEAAGESLQRALELDPQDPHAHHQWATWLSSQGRHDEALAAAERARALDPASWLLASDVGLFALYADQWERAIAESRRVEAIAPDYPWPRLWILYAATAAGNTGLAVEQANIAASVGAARRGQASPEPFQTLQQYWEWRREISLRTLPPGARLPAAQAAMLHLGAGDRAAALDEIDRVCEDHSGWRAPFLGVDPVFDALRSEPRFRAAQECLGLPLSE